MRRIENIRGAKLNEKGEVVEAGTEKIEQRFEGRVYVWGPGEMMDLPDAIANWMIAKLNSYDRNESREDGDRTPWVREVAVPDGDKKDADLGIVRAQHKPKKADSKAGNAQGGQAANGGAKQ